VRKPSATVVNAQIALPVQQNMERKRRGLQSLRQESSNIDYFYTSRLRAGSDEGVDDIHTHPNEPRAVRFTVTAKF
jgi:hypothetical protein